MKIKELGKIITGKTPSTKDRSFWNGNIPFITPKDLQRGKHIFTTDRTITKKGAESVAGCLIPKGSICVSCIGNIGYVAITTQDSVTNQQINSILSSEKFNKDYIYYLIKSLWNVFKHYEGQSTTVSILNKSQFSNIEIPYFTLDTQNKIANILSSLDEKIELNDKINDNLSKQISTLVAHEFPYAADECVSGWHMVKLSEIASFTNGYSYKGEELQPNDGIALATIKNFDRNGGFKLEGFKELIPSSPVKPEQFADLFDILVAHTDLTQNAEVIGNAEVVLSKGRYDKVVFSMDLVCVRPIKGIGKFLLAALLHDKRFKEHCLGYVNGTTVLHLSKNALREYRLLVPNDTARLIKLDSFLNNIYRKQSEIIGENIRLSEIRDILLEKLLSGEVEVPDLLKA